MCIMASENGVVVQSIAEIVHLLQDGYALAPGGRDLNGRPIIIFPDRNVKAEFTDEEFRQMLCYYTAVPPYGSPEDVERGFVIIIDRRTSNWNRVRTLISRILKFFPAPLETIFIISPSGFFQRFVGDIKLNGVKSELKANTQMVTIGAPTDLKPYVNSSQLTPELSGTHNYSHDKWIEQRVAIESLAVQEHHLAKAADTLSAANARKALPRDLAEVRALVEVEEGERKKLQDDFEKTLSSSRILEDVIASKGSDESSGPMLPPDKRIHALSLERAIARLTEAQRRFDLFWSRYEMRLQWSLRFAEFVSDAQKAKDDLTALGERVDGVLNDRSSDAIPQALLEHQELCEAIGAWDERLEGIKQQTEALEREATNETDTAALPEWPEATAERQNRCVEARELLVALDAKLAAITEHLTATGVTLHQLSAVYDSMEKCQAWQQDMSDVIEKSQGADTVASRSEAIARLRARLASRPQLPVGEELEEFLPEQSQAALAGLREAMAQVEEDCEQLIHRLDAANAAANAPRQGRSILRRDSDDPTTKCVSASCLSDRENAADLLNGNSLGEAKVEDNNRRLQTRKHVMQELIATERDYVECLERIHEVFWAEIDCPSEPSLSVPKELKEDRRSLFGNWADLLLFHKNKLLIKLESCAERPAEMGRCFQECQEEFEQYSDYCLNKFYADALLTRLGGDLHPFIRHCQARLKYSLPLSAFLLKPVQRVQKYQLLLREMLKNTPPGCEEASHLEAALNTMLRILRSLNDAMLRCDIVGYQKLHAKDLGRLLLHDNFQVSVENKNEKTGRSKLKERHVFLFEKSLLVCKSRLAGKNAEKVEYHFELEMLLEESGLTESAAKTHNARRFEVWTNNRRVILTLQAPTVEVKQCWTQRLQGLLLEQFKKLKEKAELRREHVDRSYQLLSSPSPTSKYSILPSPSPTTPIAEKTINSSASDDEIDAVPDKPTAEAPPPLPGVYPETQV